MENNPTLITAGVALVAALISLLVSLLNMRNQRKLGVLQYKIGYLNEKRKLLESERELISGLGNIKAKGKLSKENLATNIANYANTLVTELPISFSRIGPYLKGGAIELNDKVKRINSFMGSERAKMLYGEAKKDETVDDLNGGNVIDEIFKIKDQYINTLNAEIISCIEAIEKDTKH